MRPFHDLLAGYRAQEDELRAAVQRVLESGRYLLGEELAAFERAFAAAVGVPHAVGLSSGTDALVLALRALDVGYRKRGNPARRGPGTARGDGNRPEFGRRVRYRRPSPHGYRVAA
jgi:hypothetical protein